MKDVSRTWYVVRIWKKDEEKERKSREKKKESWKSRRDLIEKYTPISVVFLDSSDPNSIRLMKTKHSWFSYVDFWMDSWFLLIERVGVMQILWWRCSYNITLYLTVIYICICHLFFLLLLLLTCMYRRYKIK